MVYAATGLKPYNGGSVGAGVENSKQLIHYATNDAKAVVEGSGYFNAAAVAGVLRNGDIIIVAGDIDGTEWCAMYIASVSAANAVTLTIAASS